MHSQWGPQERECFLPAQEKAPKYSFPLLALAEPEAQKQIQGCRKIVPQKNPNTDPRKSPAGYSALERVQPAESR